MNKAAAIILGLVLFLSQPDSVLAATISITGSPSSVAREQEFSVNFSTSGLETSGQYHMKVRIGKDGTYTKGETKSGDTWLGDTDAWTSFPTFTTDGSGAASAIVAARARATADLGANQLFVRLRKVGSSTNVSPDGESTISITEAATPTPTSVPTSTPTLTPTPTPKATSTPTPTPKVSSTTSTVTSGPSPTPTPAKKPTPPSGVNQTQKEELVLGEQANSPTPTPQQEATGSAMVLAGAKTAVLAGVFIVAGLALVGFAVYSFLQKGQSAKIDDREDF